MNAADPPSPVERATPAEHHPELRPPQGSHAAAEGPADWVVRADQVATGEDLELRDQPRARRRRGSTPFPTSAAGDAAAGASTGVTPIPVTTESAEPGTGSLSAGQAPVDVTLDADADGERRRAADDQHAARVAMWRRRTTARTKKKRPFWVELPILILVAFTLTFLIQTFIAKVYYVPSGSMEKTIHGVQSGGDRILASKILYDFRHPRQGDVVVFKGPDERWDLEVTVPGPTTWIGKAFAAVGSVVGIAPPNEKDFVKRVIAVGGQTVACCDTQGNVTVDGRSLTEPYIFEPLPFTANDPNGDCTPSADGLSYPSPTGQFKSRCFAPFKVPDGDVFVMGDHRSDSSDSSYLCLGQTAAGAAAYEAANGISCARPIPASDVIGRAIFVVMPPSRWRGIGNPTIDPGASSSSSAATAAVPVAGGLTLTLALRGGLALTPARRRRRRIRRGR